VKVGIPMEVKVNDCRVSATPHGVREPAYPGMPYVRSPAGAGFA